MKKGLVVAGLLVLAAAGGGGYYAYSNGMLNMIGLGEAPSKETVYVTAVSTLMGGQKTTQNRFSGVVEPQNTVEVNLDSGRAIKQLSVKVGDEVKAGQLLFEYDLSSIQSDLQQAQLDLERLQNEALSLTEQISTLEKEKKKAKQDAQLSYTIEIETNKMNLKKNEYDQKSKQAEIDKLSSATGSTEVRAEIDGIIQKIDNSKITASSDSAVVDALEDNSYSSMDSDSSGAFITILSTGAYRVKGTVNEMNINDVYPGSAVIIRSRVNEDLTWTGTMGSIDMDTSSTQNNNSMMGYSDSGSDSTSYPFYVELDTSEDLMLGQHVFIEMDEGQLDQKDGLWLSDFFIVDADQEDAYVWVADDKNRLRKQIVTLGNHDDGLMEYEILDGITEDSLIAFPTSKLEEGMSVIKGTGEQTLQAMFETDDTVTYEYETDESGELTDDSGEAIYDLSEFDESGMTVEGTDGDMGEIVIDDSSDDSVTVVEESYTEDGELVEFSTDDVVIEEVYSDDTTEDTSAEITASDDLMPLEEAG